MVFHLFLFDTTHDTVLAEQLARRAGYDVQVVPQPPGRTGRCGIALQVAPAASAPLRGIFLREGLGNFDLVEG